MEDYNLTSFPSKILLVIPSVENNAYSFSTPSLGLGYVGASLLSQGHRVKLIDMNLHKINLSGMCDIVNNYKPEIIGITGFTPQYLNMIRIANLIKEKNPNIIIVLGGPHANALSELILKNEKNVDFIIKGEGEKTFPLLLKCIYGKSNFDSISGLAFRKDGKIHINAAEPIEKLDDLEYPWKVINPLDYQQGKVHGFICRSLPIVQVMSSRGCPYSCAFCASTTVHGRKIRLRSPSKFVDELVHLKKDFGIKEVQIVDDNFAFYREHAMAVSQEMVERKCDMFWSLPNGVRSDRLDEELLGIMKKSGCYYLSFGVEFGSPRMLKITKKSLDLKKAQKNIRLANKLGFITQGFFLLGYPEETAEDVEMTKKFIRTIPFDKILLILPFPYPGSELFEYYVQKRYGSVWKIDWDNFIKPYDFPRIFENLNAPYVREQRLKMFAQFYFNPLNILRFLFKFRTWIQFRSAVYGFSVYLNALRRNQ